jgi:LysR family transcriptional regulator of gallate degradation
LITPILSAEKVPDPNALRLHRRHQRGTGIGVTGREHPAPGHLLTGAGELSVQDLTRYKWIVPGPAAPRFQEFRKLFGKQHLPVADIVTTAARGISRGLIADSDRLTLLTRQEAISEQSMGVMSILPFACNLPAPAYGLMTRMGWVPTPAQQQFLEIVRAMAAETGVSGERTSGAAA